MKAPALLELLLVAAAPELARAGLRIVPVAPTVVAPADDADEDEDEERYRFEADDRGRVARCV